MTILGLSCMPIPWSSQRVSTPAQQTTGDQQDDSSQQQAAQQHEQQEQEQQMGAAAAAAAAATSPMAVDKQPGGGAADHGRAAAVEAAFTAVTEDDISALYDSIPEADEAAKQPAAKQQRQASGNKQQSYTGASPAAAAAANDDGEERDDAAAATDPQSSDAAVGRSQRPTYTARPEQLEQLLTQGFNSCIIAAPRLHTASILQEVLSLLAPSTPFAVFSPWMQPLAEAMQQLTSNRQAVLLQLQESWMRPYQVLPGRTHPHMAMTTGGTGGYILSGITVAASTAGEVELEQGERGWSAGRGSGGRRGRGGRRNKRQR